MEWDCCCNRKDKSSQKKSSDKVIQESKEQSTNRYNCFVDESPTRSDKELAQWRRFDPAF